MNLSENQWSGEPKSSSGWILVILAPVLALGSFTVILALVAGLFGWHTTEMLIAAAGVGGTVTMFAAALLFRQITERRMTRQTLQNVEARVEGIVDSAMDAIVAVDDRQRIILFNAAAEKVFLWPRAAVMGQPLDMLIPAHLRHGHQQHVERFGKTGVTSRRMGDKTVLKGLRANGEEFPIEASISHHAVEGGQLYTVILRDVTERVRTDDALRRSREELRELAAAAHSVREQEKSRIARELHDELAQALTALKMDVSWIEQRLPKTETALSDKLASMQVLLNSTVAATRRISADLRPLMLDDLGLVPAAEWLVQNFTQRTGIQCELAIDNPDLELQDIYATAVFRILQESLTNIGRHAQASQVEVTIERDGGAIMLTVRDNGRGFSTKDPRKPASYGLLGLRERAYLLGGEVNIDSAPGKGTIIEVCIPLAQNPVQA